MQYDQMFLLGSIIIGAALLAVTLLMSERDFIAGGILTLMILGVIAIFLLTSKIDLIAIVSMILVIVAGVILWNLRVQRVRQIRSSKSDKTN